jgi:UDP-GlcNAc:undecaprenyl-phosphate/decaprenyl-phosphate GlcNAc-1-phosphate transferase
MNRPTDRRCAQVEISPGNRMRIIAGSLTTLLLATLFTLIVRKIARTKGIVAAPRQDRWHSRPTALLGGVAIYLAFMLGYMLFGIGDGKVHAILAAGSLLFATGLIDDLNNIKPHTKLVVQLVAAASVVYLGLQLPWTNYKPVNDVITIFWIVGITNAINLLDNMDGLAGGISLISCAYLAVTFLLSGQTNEMLLPALLGGAVLGFLFFNFNPASIFMGDCGSMFLGFVLSGMALRYFDDRPHNLTAVLLAPVLILLIPIFDTSLVTVSRKLSGRPISQGGRDHSSHRLVALGMTERRAVMILYLLAVVSGALALLVWLIQQEVALLLVPGFAISILLVGLYLGKVRVYEDGDEAAGKTIIRVLADFSYKRRVFEVILDLLLVALAYYGAYLLRFDGNMPEEQRAIFIGTLPLVVVAHMLCFLLGGVYRGLWRYAGIDDLITIAKSVLMGTIASAAIIFAMGRFRTASRAVLVLDALLLFIFVGASRLSFRLLRALIVKKGNAHPDAKPVLIYGAGDGGEILIREILNNPGHRYTPVGFIDDDARKAGKLIHGYRIFSSNHLPDLIRRHGVNDVLVSSAKVSQTRLDHLRSLGMSLRTMNIRIE